MPAAKSPSLADWIKSYLKEEEPRSKSLIVSVFGDSIAPHSPGLWLSELIQLMEPLGVNERLVRTSAFRLIEEHWLTARRDGRRSHYMLTESGSRRFEVAYSRIYTPPQIEWDGNWTLVLLPRNGDSPPERLELRRELEWEGFASPTPGLLLHPSANLEILKRVLAELRLADRAIVLRAQSLDEFTPEPTATLVSRCWDFTDIGDRYRQFIARFQPLVTRLRLTELSNEQAFVVQTLLIHSFRRATLHDPRLPVSMLPSDWIGYQAYQLCRDIYQLTYRPARAHLASVTEAPKALVGSSVLRSPVQQRFGGLA
jgi:phenylacetic acid degradation operon negative regulatory protein